MSTIDPTILGIIMPILFLVWHGAAALVFREPQRPAAARTQAAARHTGSAAPEPTRSAARPGDDQRPVAHAPRSVELQDAA